DVMTPHPVTAPADLTVADFVDHYLRDARHSTIPLVDEAGPAGVVTLARLERVPPGQRASTRLRDAARPMSEGAGARPEEEVAELLPRLSARTGGRALVVSHGELVGVVSPTDVRRALRGAALRRAGR